MITSTTRATTVPDRWRRAAASAAVSLLILSVTGCAATPHRGAAPDGTDRGEAEAGDGRRREPARIGTPRMPMIGDAEAVEIRTAVDRAIGFVEPQLDDVPNLELAFFDWMGRNWRIEEFAGAAQRSATSAERDGPNRAVLQRLVDPAAVLPDRSSFDAAPGAFFEYDVMAVAMHCDHRPMSEQDVDVAMAAVADGAEYEWSHTAYALRWMEELGCVVPGVEELREAVISALTGALGTATVADDASLSASAALVVSGRADLVPDAFRRIVLDQQQVDGGWAGVAGESADWHATALAIWTLSSALDPGRREPMLAFG